ncbi:enoyl-CoA hydratase/isomerase family protein [Eisenibacter elegans]|jgi:enoyl-CoA hydratase|uniref:enoyl-CoA hydratase/isomerase family protein n=1 Tax=Eisenibacter elegans TaxID=997 RepID=UPI0004191741|nr:enoyl-CoA hydratase-related protein [Eisenibacter elegans]
MVNFIFQEVDPTHKNIRLTVDQDGIATITICRASKLNALNFQTIEDIRWAMQQVYEREDIKSVIITGEGTKAFAAGADIAELVKMDEVNAKRYSQNGQDVYAMLENCTKPVIAAVNGYALGGGCELALACHMRVAVENAKFGLPEVKLGTLPGFGGTQRLTQSIGKAKTLELIMTGDSLSAKEAKELGLVNHVVSSQENLMKKCKEILLKISSSGPLAVEMVIKSVNAVYSSQERGYQKEAQYFGWSAGTHDFHEGMQAFLEKRKPEFKGK